MSSPDAYILTDKLAYALKLVHAAVTQEMEQEEARLIEGRITLPLLDIRGQIEARE